MNLRVKGALTASLFVGTILAPMTAMEPAGASVPASCPSSSANFCLYYDGNETGAVWKLPKGSYQYDDLKGLKFGSTGDGHGQAVKNNAASAAAPVATLGFYVFYNENCSGPYDHLAGGTSKNLVNTWNEDASVTTYQDGDGCNG